MEIQKIRIVSNNISYGHCPMPEDEVEQRLTITADGRVWFSGYNLGQGFGKYENGRTRNLSIGKDAATRILKAVGACFSDDYVTVFVTDIGCWEMTITNTEGKPCEFKGSLNADFIIADVDLSDLIRDTLDMPDLFLFDGNNKPDRIDRIEIDYHRAKIKPAIPSSDNENYSLDYSEKLVLDRKTETLEHIQRIGSGCIISRKYYVQEGVTGLLDDYDADSLFEHTVGNAPDVITDPNETKDYKIIVDFHRRSQCIISGTYDKNGLPEDWPELAEDILNFMRVYGMGEILDPAVYKKAIRKTNDLIFCSVEFNGGGKSYYYLTEDDTLEIGDFVIVPVGMDSRTSIVKIVNIEYFPEDKIPFPFDKVKRVIRECTDEDFDPMAQETETVDTEEFFCLVYSERINQNDCDEISCGAKKGIIPNTELPKLMKIEDIKQKRELYLTCEKHKNAQKKPTYSDNWLKQGHTSGDRIKVSDIIDYRVWSDKNGSAVGVTVDFETADDFHYELLTVDWGRFLSEVLCITDAATTTAALHNFLGNGTDLFAFEDALKSHDIKYKKIAYY